MPNKQTKEPKRTQTKQYCTDNRRGSHHGLFFPVTRHRLSPFRPERSQPSILAQSLVAGAGSPVIGPEANGTGWWWRRHDIVALLGRRGTAGGRVVKLGGEAVEEFVCGRAGDDECVLLGGRDGPRRVDECGRHLE
jgi:hypothetical protein